MAATEADGSVTWDLPVFNVIESQDKFSSMDNESPLLVFVLFVIAFLFLFVCLFICFLSGEQLSIYAIFNIIGPAGLMHH